MCGICGILSDNRQADYTHIIEKMMEKLVHRGPDGSGMYHEGGMHMGFRRLAIIDLKGGQQPMHSLDRRYSLVFNGEIYNYVELRQSLIQQGVEFRTFSDTEVLLQMLINYGAEALNKLNGMFAFAFYDHHTEEWLMARDPFGIKPLYYFCQDDEFIFASEIKALLVHPDVPSVVNETALSDYLTFQFVLGNQTLFHSIYKLEPGHLIRGQRGSMQSVERYFEVDFQVDDYHTQDYFVDRLRYLIEDSVRLQTRSDVALGSYLSGGIDSSYITSIAADVLGHVKAFHGYFAEGDDYDESKYARAVSNTISSELFMVRPTADQFVDDMQNIIYMMDEPLAGPGVFPQYRVSRFARERVTVILGGQGGDEMFGGYARYLVAYLEQALKGAIYQTNEDGRHIVTLDSLIPNLPLLSDYRPLLQKFWSQGLFQPMDARYFHLIDRSPNIKQLLTEDAGSLIEKETTFENFQRIFNRPDTQSYINKMTNFDLQTLLPALLHVEDRVSMAVSLESRVPFLDTRILELVAQMPPALKFSAGRSKYILKLVAQTRLPEKVVHRSDKMGFPVPLKEWRSQSPVGDFLKDTLLGQRSRERGLFKPERLKYLVENETRFGRELWGALCLELWYQTYVDA